MTVTTTEYYTNYITYEVQQKFTYLGEMEKGYGEKLELLQIFSVLQIYAKWKMYTV